MRDIFGLVPSHVKANVEREEMADRHLEMARELTKALRRDDPNLEVVWVGERAPATYGWKPGRWHVRRSNPGAPDSYIPITGPNGEYVEPHFGILEELRSRDLWRKGGLHRVEEQFSTQEAAADAVDQEKMEAAREEFRERAEAYDSPAVSMSSGWSAKTGGRKGVKGVVGS